jgi:hypothetical protein
LNNLRIGSFSIDKQWLLSFTEDLNSFLTPSGSWDSLQNIADTVGGVMNWVALFIGIIILSIYSSL